MPNPGRTRIPGRLLLGWLSVLAAGLIVQALPPLGVLDLKLLDRGFSVLRQLADKPASAQIAIIGIDDATLAAFPEPIALWHRYLGGILRALAQAKPKAVGVDIELPERSYDFVRPESDRALLSGMLAMRAAAPLVIARGVDRSGTVKPLHALFAAAAGEQGTGLASWPLDADARVRRFDEALGERDAAVATFTGQLARRLGIEPHAGWIDFALGTPFSYVPAHEVFDWAEHGDAARMQQAFADRIVLIGSVLPFVDRHALPVALAGWEEGDNAPGILIHAQALRSLLGPGLIRRAPGYAPWMLIALASLAWFALGRVAPGIVLLAVSAAIVVAGALWLLYHGTYVPLAGGLATALIGAGGRVGHDAWFNRRERERLKRSFEGYVSPNVLSLILRGDLDSETGSGRRMLCVLFADIRNFTTMSEHSPPEAIVGLLNVYFERMTHAIHAHDGTVDNFRGDGIMCFFGAPQPTSNPCRQGFMAAKGMLSELAALNRELENRALPALQIGLSLAYGEAIVGRIGAASRHEYTAIGDVANVSARLESMTKEFGYPLLLSAAVVDALGAADGFDDLGSKEIRGHAPVHVYGWPARHADAACADIETMRASHG